MTRHCTKTLLVALDEELPSDPSVAYDGGFHEIGCNHLVCHDCGADVRHADGCSVTSNMKPDKDDAAELYNSVHPEKSKLLATRANSRAYFCRCAWASVDFGTKLVDVLDQMWGCGGHPAKP